MTRRSLAAVLAAATLLPGNLGAHAVDPAPEFPRSTCTKRFTDPPGDASAPPALSTQKAPGLDVIGGFIRTTETAVQVFLEVDDIPAQIPQTDPAWRYNVDFKYNSKLFEFEMIAANPVVGATLFPDTKPKATPGNNDHTGGLDVEKDFFWVSMPRATFEAKAGIPLEAGAQIEVVRFLTEYLINTGAAPQRVDWIEPTGDAAKWTVFDDYCFGPPPGKLSDLTVKNVQYGDATTMSVKLVSDTDAPLAGKPVQFSIAGDPAGAKTATTNASGVATATFVSKAVASTKPYVVTAAFLGDETDGKAKLTGAITISQEKTAFAAPKIARPSATARTVTATLLDDDKKPVAGQKVEFLVNGRKAATVVTNSKGQAVYKGAKAGQTVNTRFVAVSGKYLGATSAKYKV